MDLENSFSRDVRVSPIKLFLVFLSIVFIILLVLSSFNNYKGNSFGSEIKIDNILEFYSDLPEERQDLIFAQLYEIVVSNLGYDEVIPSRGALVREDSVESNYDSALDVHYGSFIVDIPEIERSYRVQFEWSSRGNNQNLSGYPVIVSCLPTYLQIYGNYDENCEDFIELEASWENEYQLDYTLGTMASYKIRKVIGQFLMESIYEEKYKIVIDETSLSRVRTQPGQTFSFSIILNDRFEFKMIVRLDDSYGNEYIAIYIDGNDIRKGFVMAYSDDIANALSSWLIDISGVNDLSIQKEELNN